MHGVTEIPPDVIAAAYRVRRWVDSHMQGYHDISICGVGVRTFLSVKEMLDESTPDQHYSELIESG
jgi:hypothetical protein